MKSEVRKPSDAQKCDWRFRHLDFDIPSDFVIRHSGLRIEVLLARAVSTPPASTGAASEGDRQGRLHGCGKRFHRETDCAPAARRSRPPVEFEILPVTAR